MNAASDIPRLLGEKIQAARVLRNQTQESFAKDIGLSVRVVRKLETGESVTLDTFLRAVEKLNYTDDLLRILDRPKPVTIADHLELDKQKYKPRRRAR